MTIVKSRYPDLQVKVAGSDITKDAGDIILINNELKAVLKSINLSIESMKIIKQKFGK